MVDDKREAIGQLLADDPLGGGGVTMETIERIAAMTTAKDERIAELEALLDRAQRDLPPDEKNLRQTTSFALAEAIIDIRAALTKDAG